MRSEAVGLAVLVLLVSSQAHAQSAPSEAQERSEAPSEPEPEPEPEPVSAPSATGRSVVAPGPEPSPVASRACAGEGRPKWVLSQVFGAQTNPEGGENTFRLGACFPLITTPGILFSYTNFEVGLVNYLSPAFAHLGPYIQLTPLSLLQLRVEATGFVVWPIGLPRAGYYEVAAYDSPYTPDDLSAEDGGSTTGFRLDFFATLRLRVALVPELAVIALSVFQVGYWNTNGGDHYLNLRWDVIMAREDWIAANELFFGFETPVTPDFAIRYGGFDSFRWVPANNYVGHQLGLFLMGYWPKPDTIVLDLTPFIRVGYYIDHAFRVDSFSVLAGVITQYDLGPI